VIANIQLLRFLAAAAVVYYHTGFGIWGTVTEFGAVPVFFCISGYIMTLITRDRADGFFLRRLIRVVPLYWALTLAYWAMITLGQRPERIPAAVADLGPLMKSLLFIPYLNPEGHMQPVLNVGWTLNYEMYFYLVFGVCLMINRQYAPLICSAIILGLWALLGQFPNEIAQFYADQHILYFVAGIAVYYISERIHPTPVMLWALMALALLYPLQGFFLPHVSIAPAVLVFVAIVLEKGGLLVRSKLVLLLGAASYAVYLGHFLILHPYRLAAIKLGVPAFETNVLAAILVTLLAIVFGVVIHLKLETPLGNKLKPLIAGRKQVVGA